MRRGTGRWGPTQVRNNFYFLRRNLIFEVTI
jgi:hypothetical protein